MEKLLKIVRESSVAVDNVGEALITLLSIWYNSYEKGHEKDPQISPLK